ncbi:hypothetical protein ACFOGI_03590 [Virgibacillus xinjiangensis]|uniref:Uncharacterized protein n=1 Tax=Virgibacillus xinjiangensis TaxID=393090 RepID=A0ABV7CSH2_9BACI
MKRYLTAIFIAISVVVIIIGISIDLYWSGIAAWGTALICLLFAAYYTKYIPNEKKKRKS